MSKKLSYKETMGLLNEGFFNTRKKREETELRNNAAIHNKGIHNKGLQQFSKQGDSKASTSTEEDGSDEQSTPPPVPQSNQQSTPPPVPQQSTDTEDPEENTPPSRFSKENRLKQYKKFDDMMDKDSGKFATIRDLAGKWSDAANDPFAKGIKGLYKADRQWRGNPAKNSSNPDGSEDGAGVSGSTEGTPTPNATARDYPAEMEAFIADEGADTLWNRHRQGIEHDGNLYNMMRPNTTNQKNFRMDGDKFAMTAVNKADNELVTIYIDPQTEQVVDVRDYNMT